MTLLGPLYHWSPRDRLASISRLGLVPGRRNIAGPVRQPPRPAGVDAQDWPGEFRQSAVCASLDAATAWSYSHGAWGSTGSFDLWQFLLVDGDDVQVLRQWGPRVVEVRVHNRVRKARLLWVGERKVIPRG